MSAIHTKPAMANVLAHDFRSAKPHIEAADSANHAAGQRRGRLAAPSTMRQAAAPDAAASTPNPSDKRATGHGII